jgi:hypothetical protein
MPRFTILKVPTRKFYSCNPTSASKLLDVQVIMSNDLKHKPSQWVESENINLAGQRTRATYPAHLGVPQAPDPKWTPQAL